MPLHSAVSGRDGQAPLGAWARTVDVAMGAVNDKLRAGTKGDVDRDFLEGQAIPLIEEQPGAARNLHSPLQRFGAEVVLAPDAVEATERFEEFDFSSARLNWSPDSPQHSAIAHRLKEEGVRFLFRAKVPPEGVTTSRGAPIIAKSATPDRAVGGQCNSRSKGIESPTYARSPLTLALAQLRVLVAAALIRPANSPKLICK
jgi:hypothetical protein